MSRRANTVQASDGEFSSAPVLSDAFNVLELATDAALIVFVGFASRLIYQTLASTYVGQGLYFGASLMLAFSFTILMKSRGGYEPTRLVSLDRQIRATILCWVVSFALAISVGFVSKASAELSRGAVMLFAVLGLAALILRRICWRFAVSQALSRGVIRTRKAILVSPAGSRASPAQISALEQSGVEVVQNVLLPSEADGRAEALTRVVSAVRRTPVDEIVVALASHDLPQLDEIAAHLRLTPLPVRLLPDAELSRLTLQRSRGVGSFALVDITREPLSAGELACKRALDVTIAGLALVAVAPLLVLALAAIRLDTPGPVLFRQSRRGFNGRLFKILKLRTMTVLEDGEGIVQATRKDPRVTRVGYWLRRTSIDELPQLWNVLRGEMSIVGPRPHAVAHDNYYDQLIENYAFRHHVKPGLTGWAQVNGLRGETPDVSMMSARIDHDVWYIGNWSLLLDLRILLLTCTKIMAKTAY